MSDEMILTCPIHGQVEGVIPMDGPLSNAVPQIQLESGSHAGL